MLARILSSLLFFALFLFGLFSNRSFAPHIIFVIVAAATVLGTHEYYNLARHLHIRPSPWPGHAIALAFLADAFFFQFGDFVYIFITCFWMLLITQVFLKRYDHSVANTACSLFGSIYVGLPLAMLLDVFRNATAKWDFTDPIAGGNLVLFLVLTSWATDIGGYCIGKPFGKHKMTPVLSPNKSYEGLAGGAALAVAVLAGAAGAEGIALALALGLADGFSGSSQPAMEVARTTANRAIDDCTADDMKTSLEPPPHRAAQVNDTLSHPLRRNQALGAAEPGSSGSWRHPAPVTTPGCRRGGSRPRKARP